MDAAFGQGLAENQSLTDCQAHYARKLVQRYQGQLDDDLVEKAL